MPEWWRRFGDPELDALVREGLAANRDLRIATSRVDEFAARVGATRAEGLPQVGYGASGRPTGGRQRGRRQLFDRVVRQLGTGPVGTHPSRDEAARANLLSTEQARLGVALTLVSTIVSGYVTLLDLDRSLQIAQATVQGRKQNVELFRLRLEGGAVSDFEMMQVTAEYETAVGAIPDLQQAIAQQENALSVLVGRNPGPIKRGRALEALAAHRCRRGCRPTSSQGGRTSCSPSNNSSRPMRSSVPRARCISRGCRSPASAAAPAANSTACLPAPRAPGHSLASCWGRSSLAAPSIRPTAKPRRGANRRWRSTGKRSRGVPRRG